MIEIPMTDKEIAELVRSLSKKGHPLNEDWNRAMRKAAEEANP